jgi:hypothetical protein
MTPETFVSKLNKLGYTPHNADDLLGIGRSSAFKYASGESEIPEIAVKLLEMYERYGIPKEK